MNIDPALRVMVVEDDAIHTCFIARLLMQTTSFKEEPICVTTLQEACTTLGKSLFDIIVLDLNLSDSEGLETLNGILNAQYDGIIIVTTAETNEAFLERALTCGAADYLIKGRYDALALKKAIFTSCLLRQKERQLTTRIQDVEKTNEKYKESENRFRLLYNVLSTGIFNVDSEGLCNQVNEAYGTILEASLQESYEKKWFEWVRPDFQKKVREEWNAMLNKRGKFLLDYAELPVVTAKGQERFVSLSVKSLTSDEGLQFVGTMRDITEHKKEEDERKSLERELHQSQKLESIGTLAAGVAHEINTPIQFIANNTGFAAKAIEKILALVSVYKEALSHCTSGEQTTQAMEKAQEAEKRAKLSFLEGEIPRALQQTQEGVDRVTKIVSAMKDFSHMGTENMHREDINNAIESTITISRNEWKYVAKMDIELDSSLPMVECFVGDIKQVVLNLIVNAAHAIADALKDSEEKMGLITVRTYGKDGAVFITVSDTGTGIPEEAQSKVFDHFFTTKEVGKGTGQGLSMAYQSITEKHKGALSFETEIGKGTTFIIELPITDNTMND